MAKQQSAPSSHTGLRVVHGSLAWLGIVFGLPLALVGVMALGLEWIEHPYVRLGIAVVLLTAIPAVLADRLLPSEPGERRPGLVRDVIAVCWAGAALLVVALSSSFTGDALRSQADQFETRGLSRAAWLGRWMAGPASATDLELAPTPVEPTLALADPPAPVEPTPPQPVVEPPTVEASLVGSDDAAANTAAANTAAAVGVEAPTQAASEREYSPTELFSTYAPSVVSIKIDHGGFHSGGTGFFIDAAGTIATNDHVIDGARTVRVKLWDGTELERVELLASDPDVDLALLRIDPSALPKPPTPTLLGDSEAVQVGEPVSVIGNPLGLDHTLTNGIVSARRVYEGERYIQMSAPISPGNSGGPVFDRHGRVIAVSVAQMIGGQNLNLAVPVSQLQAMVADSYPNRRSFGASSW